MKKEKFIIHGGKKLRGEISVGGAKNATFPILSACLLTKEDCVIDNLPLVEDVFRMIEILKSMNVKIDWLSARKVRINSKNLDVSKIDKKKVLQFRGAVLLFGALLARLGKAELPKPGGCIIGVRPIDTHLDAFRQLDMKIEEGDYSFSITTDGKNKRKQIVLNEISVTGTENILLFAALNEGEITLKMADMDYPSQDLIKFLERMGVEIERGFHTIKIKGRKELKGAEHKIMYDPIEAGTYLIMAAATNSKILIKNVEYSFLEFVLKKFKDFGIPFKVLKSKEREDLKDIRMMPWKELKIEKVQSMPYPGLPSDLLPLFGVLATQSKGSTMIHDPMYDGRLEYLKGLRKMGAEIFFSDPHRAIINGPTALYGEDLGSFDLRAGASLIIAGLIAKGKTVIRDVYQVDRGYEEIEKKLRALGADIKRKEQI